MIFLFPFVPEPGLIAFGTKAAFGPNEIDLVVGRADAALSLLKFFETIEPHALPELFLLELFTLIFPAIALLISNKAIKPCCFGHRRM